MADYVRTCDTCQCYGPKEHHNELYLYHPSYPFEVIFLNFIVNLPKTSKQNHHIITMTEGFTKWIEAKALREATSKNTTEFLIERIILRFGVLSMIITDNGSHFQGEFHELCSHLNI